jgi:GNAT superfamily N-acetyltransferase
MDELEHASAFEESLRERAADRVVPFRFGTAVVTESLADVWDLNLLRVEKPGASAAELAEEAERIQGGADLRHRRVVMLDGAEAEAFEALGWESGRFLFMRYRGPGERNIDTARVREVDRAFVGSIREEMARTAPWATDEGTVRRVMTAQERVADAANARHFAVLEGDDVVSTAELFTDGATAQVEDVVTLETHRGHGYASAVVLAAVERALAEGCDFVFLVADDEDWPKELYARLGFEPIGRKWTFIRKLD